MSGVPWRVRAEDDYGERYPDPSPKALDDLVAYVTDTGGYLVVERAGRPGGHFAQVILGGTEGQNSWEVQVREGFGNAYFHAVVDTIAEAQRVLRAWAFDEGEWQSGLGWQRAPWA